MERAHDLAISLLRAHSMEHVMDQRIPVDEQTIQGFQNWIKIHFRRSHKRVMLASSYAVDWERLVLPNDVRWTVAPHYDVKFAVAALPNSQYNNITSTQFQPPRPNPFVPRDLRVLPVDPEPDATVSKFSPTETVIDTEATVMQCDVPTVLSRDRGCTVWYKRDNVHLLPLAYIYCRIHR